MSLARRLAIGFSWTTQKRGQEYFHSGRVIIVHGTGNEVKALIRGSQRYYVEIGYVNNNFQLSCTCLAAERGPCKHAWATVLAAEAEGHLSGVPKSFEASAFTLADVRGLLDRVPPPPPPWRKQLDQLPSGLSAQRNTEPWPERREILYVIDVPLTRLYGLVLNLRTRDRRVKGDGWTKVKELRMPRSGIARLPDAADREIITSLAGARQYYSYSAPSADEQLTSQFLLPGAVSHKVLREACATGRCMIQIAEGAEPVPVEWDDGEPWRFRLEMKGDGIRWTLGGRLDREGESMALSEPAVLLDSGFLVARGRIARLEHGRSFPWIALLRDSPAIHAPDRDRDALLAAVLERGDAPPIAVPDELRYEEADGVPRPGLRIARNRWRGDRMNAEASFDYGLQVVPANSTGSGFFDTKARRLVRRDAAAEEIALAQLRAAGLRWAGPAYSGPDGPWDFASSKLPAVVRRLVGEGWHVEADGKTFRRPGATRLAVTSGIDWFDLNGEVDYGGATATLPALLAALKRGDGLVALDDGTFGLLPEEWVARLGPVAGLGSAGKEGVRFHRGQAGLLDALLAARPDIRVDEGFARAREELRAFEGVHAEEQPAGFRGQLRDYQKEGLGWMRFLDRFAFGGCLADDMGVGKTAQVLAMLESRRAAGGAGPSLAVVPRSLVFNWKQEAERFAPRLRVLDHTGTGRSAERFGEHDLVLTTYGTLRRDAPRLQDIEFDYVILDEAQAIKNADSESAKAARLLRARRRLALSGTPIENHLGELWSLFEFLNPGMLGGASVFKSAGGLLRNPDAETRALLAQALRPFILRRTKEQVARELPAKTEQTIFCEMEPAQRRLYDELRDHYRRALLPRIAAEGLAKSKIQVLEALLRLRQAACHPALLDAKFAAEPSAKLDTLAARLEEVGEEGHKALVFSQFTSLLAIVRRGLDAQGVKYEYLDGRTRDRQERVERFQNDPECGLFLVSLKAGGLGLNLTAAEYVFLLDPWWNPAVEAQAVDRTHRIGQTRPVFAYRLIAKDTVEEKVLELQKSKRALADAILSQDNSLIRDLRREDLELLLS